MNAVEITRTLKGRWHGSYGTARCPAHRDRSPSLSLSISPAGKTLVKCHAGCSQEAVIAALRALRLWDDDVETNLRPFTPAPNRNGEYAMRIWGESEPAKGTLVEAYLASRGITIPAPSSLRFHPGLKYPEGGVWPAMVGLVTRGPDGVPVAIHRTYLKKDGSGKAPVPGAKKMLGPCQGGAVRLSEPAQSLAVGEGIETCLSVLQATGKPVWAALSTSGLKSLDLPRVVREVTVLADADEAGAEAAVFAGRRWRDAGFIVKIARPSFGTDFNDVLLRGAS